MLAVTVVSAHAASILLDKDCLANFSGNLPREPWLQHILTESRFDVALGVSDLNACTDEIVQIS